MAPAVWIDRNWGGDFVNEVEALYRERPEPEAFARSYVGYLTQVLGRLDFGSVGRFIETLIAARDRNARVFFIGNGGSASTASHFANDLSIGSRTWERPFKVISLCDNISIITAVANDYGYDEVFTRQLQVQMQSGDVVVAISASGNSPNVVAAVQYANDHDAVTVGLTGFDGGRLATLAQLVVHAPTNRGEYGPAEDVHLILDHLVGAFLMYRCAAERAPAS